MLGTCLMRAGEQRENKPACWLIKRPVRPGLVQQSAANGHKILQLHHNPQPWLKHVLRKKTGKKSGWYLKSVKDIVCPDGWQEEGSVCFLRLIQILKIWITDCLDDLELQDIVRLKAVPGQSCVRVCRSVLCNFPVRWGLLISWHAGNRKHKIKLNLIFIFNTLKNWIVGNEIVGKFCWALHFCSRDYLYWHDFSG